MRPSTRRASVVTATAALAGAALMTAPIQAQASAWSPTITHAVALNGTRLGTTPSSQRLHLTLTLTPRDAAAMQAAVKAMYTPGSATYHQYLTAGEWRADYAPTDAAVTAVTDYLRREGMTRIEVASNHLAVTAESSAAAAEQAFNTHLQSYEFHGTSVFGNLTAAQVPAALHSTITAVLGLNNVPLDAVKPVVAAAHTARAGSPDTGGQFPAGFRTTYNANGTTNGSKTKIAILSEGATAPVIASLRNAEKMEKAKRVPVTVVKAGVQSPDVSGADEFDMDTQASSIMAGSVQRLYMYSIGGLTDAQLIYGFNRWVSDDFAPGMSASIGGCEYNSFLDGSELALDVTMQQAALQGQSLFASSGDEGDACAMVANTGTPAGVPQDEWPAVGAYTVAVGGTSLVSDKDGNRIKELAWLGGGGGDSEFENPGYWTQATNPGYDSEFASGGRAVPDVALDADPNAATPVKVVVGNKIMYVGGTSLSSPLMLGIWARLESAHHNQLGLAPIALYDVYDKVNPGTPGSVMGIPATIPAANPKPVFGFTDIITGSNGLYQAKTGWDYATGLGAPNVAQLVKVIAQHPVAGINPGFRVTHHEVPGGKPGQHKLSITVHITNTKENLPATGSILLHVKNGEQCHATLRNNAGTCSVHISRKPTHLLTVKYLGDANYAAAMRTFTIDT